MPQTAHFASNILRWVFVIAIFSVPGTFGVEHLSFGNQTFIGVVYFIIFFFYFFLLIYSIGDIAFIRDKASPSLIIVHEGGQMRLGCSYCTVSATNATLSWYKDGLLICNDTRHVIFKDKLGVPVVDHTKDEGLYECAVRSKNQSISRFITVIVKKSGFE